MDSSRKTRNDSNQPVRDKYWKFTFHPIIELIMDSQESREQTENISRLVKQLNSVKDDFQREKYKVEIYELLAEQLPPEIVEKLNIPKTALANRLIYSPAQIAVGSLFGTAITGLLLTQQNFTALGRKEDMIARSFRVVLILFSLIALYFYVALSKIPPVLPLVSAIGMYYVSKFVQGDLIATKLHTHRLYRQHWVVPIFLGTVVMLIILGGRFLYKQIIL